MIRRHMMALRLGLIVADGASATAVFLLVSIIRFGDGAGLATWDRLGIDVRLAAILFGIAWVVALWVEGLYLLRVRWRLRTELRDIFRATLLVAALTLSLLFLFRQPDVSRLFLLALFVVQPIVTFAGRTSLQAAFGALRRRGHNARFMLVVGTGQLAQEFADRVESRAGLGIRVIGHILVPGSEDPLVTRPIVDTVNRIAQVFRVRVVDEVAICLPPESAGLRGPIARLATDEGKTVRLPLDPFGGPLGDASDEEFEGYLVRSFVGDQGRELGLVVKRIVDIAGATVGLLLLSPVFLLTALITYARDGSPILFRQTRVGLHGRPFTIYKFRTMAHDAEERLDEVAHLNEQSRVTFKATNDPRITSLGRSLRRTSIDELPQLWNVLRGDMSLVGPRPPLPREVIEYDAWHRRRLSMRPGITGLWQVDARDDPDFDRWVERDLTYIDNWSPWLDLRILLRTIPAVLKGEGR